MILDIPLDLGSDDPTNQFDSFRSRGWVPWLGCRWMFFFLDIINHIYIYDIINTIHIILHKRACKWCFFFSHFPQTLWTNEFLYYKISEIRLFVNVIHSIFWNMFHMVPWVLSLVMSTSKPGPFIMCFSSKPTPVNQNPSDVSREPVGRLVLAFLLEMYGKETFWFSTLVTYRRIYI